MLILLRNLSFPTDKSRRSQNLKSSTIKHGKGAVNLFAKAD
jgi:hypothetical protein